MRKPLAFTGFVSLVSAFLLSTPASALAQPPSEIFTEHIRPIFERSCWNCHGAAVQLSGLDLRTRESALTGGDGGAVIVPGRATESRLYRVLSGVEDPVMPMEGDPLTASELDWIQRWINEGAHWDTGGATSATTALAAVEDKGLPEGARDYWAFQLPKKAPVPVIEGWDAHAHPIDRFLEKTRREKGLVAAPRADKRTLVRRAYLDLIGLPPTPEETEAFLADEARGAWERLIDRLLDSPHYGERWGRHWLDVARYADSSGFEQDYDRPNAWRYRDYVVDAFNDDKPYSQFIREQIAGDELDYTTDETLIATGFLRAGPRVLFREKDNPERRYDYLDDVLATIGRGILGLTVHCARCHDHKFDPIPQMDYYRMEASIFGYVETERPLTSPEEAAAWRRANEAIDSEQQPLKDEIAELEAPYRETLRLRALEDFPENVRRAVLKPAAERTEGEKLLAAQVLESGISIRAKDLEAALSEADAARKRALTAEIEALEARRPPTPPMAEIVTDGDYRFAPDGEGDEIVGCPQCRIPPDTPGSFLHEGPGRYEVPKSYFLVRGDVHSKGSEMKPGFISVATYGDPPTVIPRPDGQTSGRRLALAEWLVSPSNPLTPRVIVNRIWHHHFGRGIVATLDNLGKMGEQPTHPELLDWLAVELRARGYSLKAMHRLIMTSEAYQMASAYTNVDDVAADPDNQFLWRYRLQRLEAEALRDAIMTASGGIDLTVGGRPVFPYIPEEILEAEIHGIWENTPDGPSVWRRSLYVYRRRSLSYPFFETFDLPSQNVTAAARNVSTVPTQALTLMNNPFVLGQARLFAERLEEEVPGDLEGQIERAYEIALARPATKGEIALATDLVQRGSLEDFTHVVLNLNEFVYLR